MSRSQPSNFRKITHLPFRNRSPWIPPRARALFCGTAKQANPSLDLPLFGTANQAPTLPLLLELLSSPYAPNPLLQPRPLVYQLRWVPPPHPTGHPSKNVIFLLFVHVRNDKIDTRCEICSVPGATPPQEPKPLDPPPEPLPRQANPSLTPKQHEANRHGCTSRGQPSNFRKITPFRNRSPWIPPRALAPSCGTAKQANPETANQALELSIQPLRPPNPLLQPRPLVYPPVHQASSGGYPPPTPQSILLR